MAQDKFRKLLSTGALMLGMAFSVACCPSNAAQPGGGSPVKTSIPDGAKYDPATRDYVTDGQFKLRYHKNCDGTTTVSGTNTSGQPFSYYE